MHRPESRDQSSEPGRRSATVSVSHRNRGVVEAVTPAAGSQIRCLESGTFDAFHSVKSICIPASVEFLRVDRFPHVESDPGSWTQDGDMWEMENSHCGRDEPLCSFSSSETISFEPASRLRQNEPRAFSRCRLKQISIPASVETNPGNLPPSDCQTEIESANLHLAATDSHVIDLRDRSFLRYLGTGSQVIHL